MILIEKRKRKWSLWKAGTFLSGFYSPREASKFCQKYLNEDAYCHTSKITPLDLRGSVTEPTWNRTKHACCGSTTCWRHKKHCRRNEGNDKWKDLEEQEKMFEKIPVKDLFKH